MSQEQGKPHTHRLDRTHAPSVQNWKSLPSQAKKQMVENAVLDCGWGRLLFGHTFTKIPRLLEELRKEQPGKRDIAFYLKDPHVLLSLAPQELFLDPSHTYRLWLDRYRPALHPPKGFTVRRIQSRHDAEAIRDLYLKRRMVPVEPDFIWAHRRSGKPTWFVAEEDGEGGIIGSVMGVNHRQVFNDPEDGSSLWCLAVDPQAPLPGVGEALTRFLAEYYKTRGLAYVDLSVMHDNAQAIALYEKLGFERVPVFCVKTKNSFNERLYVATTPEVDLNPYARIIVDEARRRGIGVEVIDAESGYFRLQSGGRSITCRESLSELTNAVAMSRCQDKRVASRLLSRAALRVPDQVLAGTEQEDLDFLRHHKRLVVKPRYGEQGHGVSVDVREAEDLRTAVDQARRHGPEVLLEEFVEGVDLRLVVINFEVVAAAVRRPASVVGTGRHSISRLIQKQSRRREAATGGESRIPLDDETRRCVREAGHSMEEVLEEGVQLKVRKTANLHSGGTIHDVTASCHPTLREVAVRTAEVLDVPVAGVDLLVSSEQGEHYVIVEVNERPGLANHEPQPTAERFVDFLFPLTAVERR